MKFLFSLREVLLISNSLYLYHLHLFKWVRYLLYFCRITAYPQEISPESLWAHIIFTADFVLIYCTLQEHPVAFWVLLFLSLPSLTFCLLPLLCCISKSSLLIFILGYFCIFFLHLHLSCMSSEFITGINPQKGIICSLPSYALFISPWVNLIQ